MLWVVGIGIVLLLIYGEKSKKPTNQGSNQNNGTPSNQTNGTSNGIPNFIIDPQGPNYEKDPVVEVPVIFPDWLQAGWEAWCLEYFHHFGFMPESETELKKWIKIMGGDPEKPV